MTSNRRWLSGGAAHVDLDDRQPQVYSAENTGTGVNGAQTTSYEYDNWTRFQPGTVTITPPVVGTGQNGSGVAEPVVNL